MSTSERPRWPWPGDTPTDRARRIANSLLALLEPGEREKAITAARAVGETWLGADLLRWQIDDIVTTEQAAELLHVSTAVIHGWRQRGLLANLGTSTGGRGRQGRYRVGDVLDCSARLRRERAAA